MKKTLLLAFVALIAHTALHSQLIVGWNSGYATARELNREIYVYNAINGHNLSKEMGEVHWYQGLACGVRVPGDGFFAELLYSRKRCKVGSEFDSSGVLMARQMKVLCNTWNFGIGGRTEKWSFGVSWDFGRYKGFGKRGAESTIGDKDWEQIWTLDDRRVLFISMKLICTETVFVERNFGFLGVRLFAQLPGINCQMDGLDHWLFGADLNYGESQVQPFFNIGGMVSLQLGKR